MLHWEHEWLHPGRELLQSGHVGLPLRELLESNILRLFSTAAFMASSGDTAWGPGSGCPGKEGRVRTEGGADIAPIGSSIGGPDPFAVNGNPVPVAPKGGVETEAGAAGGGGGGGCSGADESPRTSVSVKLGDVVGFPFCLMDFSETRFPLLPDDFNG